MNGIMASMARVSAKQKINVNNGDVKASFSSKNNGGSVKPYHRNGEEYRSISGEKAYVCLAWQSSSYGGSMKA